MDLAEYFKRGNLQEGLAALFKKSCLEIFAPAERPDSLFIEVQANDRIIEPIERFITSSSNPKQEINKLQDGNSSGVCGYILKHNEPVFTCLDCTADPTSVMCNTCFVNSEHKKHNYKMHLSSGNAGYCDCGDPEAFKKYYRCSLHKATSYDKVSPDELLPTELRDRFRATCICLLQFVLDTCFLELQMKLDGQQLDTAVNDFTKKWLDSELNSDECAAVLYNDEVHSYDQVIQTLTSSLSIQPQNANYFATVVDSVGRSVLKVGNASSMRQLSSKIRSTIKQLSGSELGCLPIRSIVFAAQNLCFHLLAWLTNIIQQLDGLHEILCQCLESTASILPPGCTGPADSIVFYLLIYTDDLWKAARKVIIELFIKSMLMKPNYKRSFAALYVKHHHTIFEKFCADNHNPEDSVTLLSVQLFTSPSLALHLVSEHNALGVLVNIIQQKTFKNSLSYDENVKRDMLVLKSSDRGNFSVWNRSFHVLRDIEYLLHNDFGDLPPQFFTAIKNVLPSFLDLFVQFQDNNYCYRHLSGHVGMDPEWELQFIFFMSSMYQNHMMAKFLSREDNLFEESLSLSLSKLQNNKPLCIKFKPHQPILCVNKHRLKSPELLELMSGKVRISHHQPLVRFISFLLECHMMNHDESLSVLQTYSSHPGYEMAWLTALRQYVWNMQIGANLWNRCGTSLLHSAIQYTQNQLVVVGMLQRDFRLLQMTAAVTNAEQFLLRIIDGFELGSWAMRIDIKAADPTTGRYTLEDQRTMVEEFLKMLICLVSDRVTPGVGQSITFINMIEEDLIQHLAAEPLSHSKLLKLANDLIKKLLTADQQLKCYAELDSVIERVAEFRPAQGQGKGQFHLREHLYSRFNPFHLRLSKSAVSKTLHNLNKRRTNDAARPLMSPPDLVPLNKKFEPLRQLLLSDVMHDVLLNVIQNCIRSNEPKLWSETQVERVLYLILIGLSEYRLNGDQASTSEVCHKFLDRLAVGEDSSVLACLETLPKGHLKLESVKELYVYTLKYIKQLRGITAAGDKVTEAVPEPDKVNEKRRDQRQKAQMRRDRLMADMMQKQKKILAEYGDQMEQEVVQDDTSKHENSKAEDKCNFLVGSSRKFEDMPNPSITCMLCQESHQVGNFENNPMVLTGFVQRSTVLSQNRGHVRSEAWPGVFVEAELLEGSHFSSCGHGMHLRCYRDFLSSFSRTPPRSLNPRSNEYESLISDPYQCPLCQNLCNSAVLVVPPLHSIFAKHCDKLNSTEVSFKSWLSEMHQVSHGLSESTIRFELNNSQYPLLSSLYSQHNHITWIDEGDVQLCLKQLRDVCAYRGLGLDMPAIVGINPPSVNGRDSALCLTLAYTIQSVEACKRGLERPLFDVLPDRCVQGLHALARIAALIPPANAQLLVTNHLRLLISPSIEELIRIDLFHSLVVLCLCLPYIFHKRPTAALCFDSERHILRLILTAHYIQIFLSLSSDEENSESIVNNSSDCFEELVQKWRKSAGLPTTKLHGSELKSSIQSACLPLLRCATLLFRALSELHPEHTATALLSEASEFEWLCELLQLPTDPFNLLSDWSYDQNAICNSKVSPTVSYPRVIHELVPLPIDYTELLLVSREFACPAMVTSSGGQPKILQPAKCLVCGDLVCSNSPCCQASLSDRHTIGGANMHALRCTGGNCLFLRVLDCTLLIMSSTNRIGCLRSGPYVDKYGETDEFLRRGQPLKLNSTFYKNLQEDWLMHRLSSIASRESQSWNFLEM